MNEIKTQKNRPLMIFVIFSFIILPAVAFPILITLNQVARFSFTLAGYWGIAAQSISLYLRESRIWALRLFSYSDEKKTGKKIVGKSINISILMISIAIFCFGVYYLAFGWKA